jgi:hypothetical protein
VPLISQQVPLISQAFRDELLKAGAGIAAGSCNKNNNLC